MNDDYNVTARNRGEELILAAPAVSVTIDTTDWSRLPELQEYARVKGLSLSAAIEHLLDNALAHEPRVYRPQEGFTS